MGRAVLVSLGRRDQAFVHLPLDAPDLKPGVSQRVLLELPGHRVVLACMKDTRLALRTLRPSDVLVVEVTIRVEQVIAWTRQTHVRTLHRFQTNRTLFRRRGAEDLELPVLDTSYVTSTVILLVLFVEMFGETPTRNPAAVHEHRVTHRLVVARRRHGCCFVFCVCSLRYAVVLKVKK